MIVTVLGGGNGGHAMAADLALKGFEVRFFDVPEFKEAIMPVIQKAEIEITGVAKTGTAQLNKVTTDIKEAVEGADVINIVTPAFAHQTFYTRLVPYVEDGQIIITHNGYFGALQLMHTLKSTGIEKDVLISETSMLVYGCRKIGAGKVQVNSIKSIVPFAAVPASDTGNVLKTVKKIFPQFVTAANVLETSLENLNFILHPPIMLLNAGRIEDAQGDFLFYAEGATPPVSRVIEELDDERMAVERALGLKPKSTRNWLKEMYGSKGKNLYEMIQDTKPYARAKAPPNLRFRYITEDVPYGLVSMASLGDLLNIPTPTAKALIHTISILNQTDYWREGLTVDKIGLAGKTAEQIKKSV